EVLQARRRRVTPQPRQEVDELHAGHILVEPQLAGEVADVAAGVDAVAPAIVAVDGGVPGGRMQEPEQQAQGGRVARSLRADDAADLARRDVEIEPIERRQRAVLFRQLVRMKEHGIVPRRREREAASGKRWTLAYTYYVVPRFPGNAMGVQFHVLASGSSGNA